MGRTRAKCSHKNQISTSARHDPILTFMLYTDALGQSMEPAQKSPQNKYKIRSKITFKETEQGPGLRQKGMAVIPRIRPRETVGDLCKLEESFHKEITIVVTEEALVTKRADVEEVRLWGMRSPLGWEWLLLE